MRLQQAKKAVNVEVWIAQVGQRRTAFLSLRETARRVIANNLEC